MKESYVKGAAHHHGPESCLDDPRGRREALAGVRAGPVLSSEITHPEGRPCVSRGNAPSTGALWQVPVGFGGVWDPAHARKLDARKSGDPDDFLRRGQTTEGQHR